MAAGEDAGDDEIDELLLPEQNLVEAAGKRAEVGLAADKFDLAQKKEVAPFNLKEAQGKADLLEEQLKNARFSNRPEIVQAELDSAVAKATGDTALAKLRTIEAEDAADPVMRQLGKDTLLQKFTAAQDESELARFNLNEARASAPDRAAMRALDIAGKRYEAEIRLSPTQAKKLNEARVLAEQISVAAADQNLRNGEAQGIANFLDIANKAEAMDQKNAVLFREAVTSFVQMKAVALANNASPEAMAEFERSTTQVIALATKLSKTSPELAAMGQRALHAALKGNWASTDTANMSIDDKLRFISAHHDAAADGFVVALTREQGGTDSRATSRPGEDALVGMVTGGAKDRATGEDVTDKPKTGVLAMRKKKRKAQFAAFRSKQASMVASQIDSIPDDVIEKIGDRCAAACKKIGYRGAGTFEFLFENGEDA